eukprot:gene11130-20015_t
MSAHRSNKDCVAIEVGNHRSCHLNYCRPVIRPTSENLANNEIYKQSYENFCCKIIKPRLLKKKENKRMKDLNNLFTKTVKEVEGLDVLNFCVLRLKSRLVRDYPQLVCHQPKIGKKIEFVYVVEISVGDLAEGQT